MNILADLANGEEVAAPAAINVNSIFSSDAVVNTEDCRLPIVLPALSNIEEMFIPGKNDNTETGETIIINKEMRHSLNFDDLTLHQQQEIRDLAIEVLRDRNGLDDVYKGQGSSTDNTELLEAPDVRVNESGRLTGYWASDNVFNLSARVLSETEIKLLSRGLKFIPTPKSIDRYQLKLDLEEYGRRLKLKIHFNEVS